MAKQKNKTEKSKSDASDASQISAHDSLEKMKTFAGRKEKIIAFILKSKN